MEAKMRLAERRGLLAGNHLSVVQEYALQLLMVNERRAEGKRFGDQMRFALLTHDPTRLRELWPDLFPEEILPADDPRVAGATEVVWEASTDLTTEQIEQIISKTKRARMTLADADRQSSPNGEGRT